MNQEHSHWLKGAFRLLESVCPEDLYEEIEGDLIQRFQRDQKKLGARRARLKLLWNIIRFFRPGILFRRKFSFQFNTITMLLSYFKIMVRNMHKTMNYTLLNVLGLALGITCALTIFLYVYDELTFDRNHARYDEIYRLNGGWKSMTDGSSDAYTGVGYIVGEYFKKDFPEIDQMVRIQYWGMNIEKPGTDEQISEHTSRVEPDVFKIFSFEFIAGSDRNPLPDANSMVMTRKTAMKYFNSVDVVGKTLKSFGHDTIDWKITGVIEDYPDNTQIKMDIITKLVPPNDLQANADWFEYRYRTYFTLKPNASIRAVEDRIQFFTKPYVSDYEKEIGFTQEHSIIPFSKIHLYSHLTGENNPQASTVFIFLIIGIFILVMACINFINLATARSLKRGKEIGVRKVAGALKSQLMLQFLSETLFITILAALLSVIAVYLLLPSVNSYSGKNLTIFNNSAFWTMLGMIVLIVSLISGGYPSFVMSAFKPSETLKGTLRGSGINQRLRQALVVFQFVVSISLIAGTLIVVNHLNFLRSKELGFNKDQVLLIQRATQATKEQIVNIAGVVQASFSNKVPGMLTTGRTIINGWDKSDPQVVMDQLVVDYDYIDLYDLEILEGRGFSKDNPSDATEAFLINETALSKLGYKNAKEAIGGELWLDGDWGDGKKGRIIGVLKDFHTNGVNSPILPFSMFMHPNAMRVLSVKISSSDLPGVLAKIEEVYKTTAPNRVFVYSFLDQDFDRQYQAEDRFMTIFTFFAGVGIIIGCLGLYGLAMFMAEQRTKEIGIRKVLGATGGSILALLTSNFLKLVAISFVLATPVAYFGMEQWLSKFPYREQISPMLFVITGCAVLAITVLTVSYQAMRAATGNPVNALRAE